MDIDHRNSENVQAIEGDIQQPQAISLDRVAEIASGERLVFIADVVVWALFATDLGVKTAISPDRRGFLMQHWLDVLIVVVPFARPFRLLRIAVYGTRAFRGVVRIFNVDFLLVYAVGLVLIVATIVTTVEEGSGSPLGFFPNSI